MSRGKQYEPPEWVASAPSPLDLRVYKDGELVDSLNLGEHTTYVLGRSRDACDILLDNTSISRQHAAIVHGVPRNAKSRASHSLIDLGSSCGTFITMAGSTEREQLEVRHTL